MAGELVTFEIVDFDDFEKLEEKMHRVAGGQLKRELGDGLAASTRNLPRDVSQSAERLLPRRGGLGSRVARSRYRTRRKARLHDAQVTFTATNDYEISYIDAGRVAHPVFGHNTYWSTQKLPSGFFTKPVSKQEPPTRRSLIAAMRTIARLFDRI